MYLHLGQDVIVPLKNILGIFDMDTATLSKHTRAMIAKLEKNKKVIPIFEDLPKSFILCTDEKNGTVLYISQISTSTLLKRAEIKFFTTYS